MEHQDRLDLQVRPEVVVQVELQVVLDHQEPLARMVATVAQGLPVQVVPQVVVGLLDRLVPQDLLVRQELMVHMVRLGLLVVVEHMGLQAPAAQMELPALRELVVHQEPPVLLGVAALVAIREQAAVVGRVVLMVLLAHTGRFWLMKLLSSTKEHNIKYLPI